jgi:tripartite motif-containing protein 71
MSSYKSNIFLYSFGEYGKGEGEINYPRGVTCDHDGNIVVSDTLNHRIQVFKLDPPDPIGLQSKLSSKGGFLYSFGSFGREEGEFFNPHGLTCDHDGNIVVCDRNNHRIQVFDPKGKFLFSFGKYGNGEGEFCFPEDLTCDHEGNIVVSDTFNHRIQIFNNKGKFLFSFGSIGEEDGQFNEPAGVTYDHDGNIVVSDRNNHRIQVFNNKGEFLFSFGKLGKEEGRFNCPSGVTSDHDGNIVVSDTLNDRIQVIKLVTSSLSQNDLQSKIPPKSEFLYIFGKYGEKELEFRYPWVVTCNNNGDYVVCDTWNHRIQVIKGPSEVPSLLTLCWKTIDNYLVI